MNGNTIQEIYIPRTVSCHGCGRTTDLGISDPRDVVYLEDILKALRWSVVNHSPYCPRCTKQMGKVAP